MDKVSMTILASLHSLKAVNPLGAISIEELMNEVDLARKEKTIWKLLKELTRTGYVKTGPKDGKANTYLISDRGIEFLENGGKEK